MGTTSKIRSSSGPQRIQHNSINIAMLETWLNCDVHWIHSYHLATQPTTSFHFTDGWSQVSGSSEHSKSINGTRERLTTAKIKSPSCFCVTTVQQMARSKTSALAIAYFSNWGPLLTGRQNFRIKQITVFIIYLKNLVMLEPEQTLHQMLCLLDRASSW